MLANAASQHVRPPVNLFTENVAHPSGTVLVVSVPEGVSKPYMDKNGVIWLKNGADKRRATSREELQRMFQQAGLIHADETPVPGLGAGEVDQSYFDAFFSQSFGMTVSEQRLPLPQLLENMNLLTRGSLNIAGALLFMTFLVANTGASQAGQSVNSVGVPEVPRIVWEELIANALMHRDYFISAPVRVFVYANRVEIISPGHLPNNLTIDNIKAGNSNIRNPILASFAAKLLPYRGLGSGVIRALRAYPNIEFIDDHEGNLFKVIIARTGALTS